VISDHRNPSGADCDTHVYGNLFEVPLFDSYDSFLIDVYGVLFDGHKLYDGVLQVLANIKKAGKQVVILSNSPCNANTCKQIYANMDLIEGTHYDAFVSSGEFFNIMLSQVCPRAKTYHQIFQKNLDVLTDCHLKEVDTISESDFVFVGTLNNLRMVFDINNATTKSGNKLSLEEVVSTPCHDIVGLDHVANILEECKKYNKPLVVINPDIFAIDQRLENNQIYLKPSICPGAIGAFYENIGGRVVYCGKPYTEIFEFAKTFLSNKKKTAMIGDSLWTDVLGGIMVGIDTILTLTGVSRVLIQSMQNLSLQEALRNLIEIVAPKMTPLSLRGFLRPPTYMINHL
jgi:HAD superfamily hydrolase (TIGR01459 family)